MLFGQESFTAVSIAELGAVGVLGSVFLLVMRWMTTQLSQQLTNLANAQKATTLTMLDMHRTLILHDAQIRGVNPSAGATPNEMHQQALDEYKQVLAALSNTSETIRNSMR